MICLVSTKLLSKQVRSTVAAKPHIDLPKSQDEPDLILCHALQNLKTAQNNSAKCNTTSVYHFEAVAKACLKRNKQQTIHKRPVSTKHTHTHKKNKNNNTATSPGTNVARLSTRTVGTKMLDTRSASSFFCLGFSLGVGVSGYEGTVVVLYG